MPKSKSRTETKVKPGIDRQAQLNHVKDPKALIDARIAEFTEADVPFVSYSNGNFTFVLAEKAFRGLSATDQKKLLCS